MSTELPLGHEFEAPAGVPMTDPFYDECAHRADAIGTLCGSPEGAHDANSAWAYDPNVISWDWKAQPDLDALADLLRPLGVALTKIDTGGDEYAVRVEAAPGMPHTPIKGEAAEPPELAAIRSRDAADYVTGPGKVAGPRAKELMQARLDRRALLAALDDELSWNCTPDSEMPRLAAQPLASAPGAVQESTDRGTGEPGLQISTQTLEGEPLTGPEIISRTLVLAFGTRHHDRAFIKEIAEALDAALRPVHEAAAPDVEGWTLHARPGGFQVSHDTDADMPVLLHDQHLPLGAVLAFIADPEAGR